MIVFKPVLNDFEYLVLLLAFDLRKRLLEEIPDLGNRKASIDFTPLVRNDLGEVLADGDEHRNLLLRHVVLNL